MSSGKVAIGKAKERSSLRGKNHGIPLEMARAKGNSVNCDLTAMGDNQKSPVAGGKGKAKGESVRKETLENAWSVQTRRKAYGKALNGLSNSLSQTSDLEDELVDENQFSVLMEPSDAELSQDSVREEVFKRKNSSSVNVRQTRSNGKTKKPSAVKETVVVRDRDIRDNVEEPLPLSNASPEHGMGNNENDARASEAMPISSLEDAQEVTVQPVPRVDLEVKRGRAKQTVTKRRINKNKKAKTLRDRVGELLPRREDANDVQQCALEREFVRNLMGQTEDGEALPRIILHKMPMDTLTLLMMYIPPLLEKMPKAIIPSFTSIYTKLLEGLAEALNISCRESIQEYSTKLFLLPIIVLAQRKGEETLSQRKDGMKRRLFQLELSSDNWDTMLFEQLKLIRTYTQVCPTNGDTEYCRDGNTLNIHQTKAWDNIAKGRIRKASMNLEANLLAAQGPTTLQKLQDLNPLPNGPDNTDATLMTKLEAWSQLKLASFAPLETVEINSAMIIEYLNHKQLGKAAGLSQLRVEYLVQMSTDPNLGVAMLLALSKVYNRMDDTQLSADAMPKQYHRIFALSKVNKEGVLLDTVRPIALGEAFYETRCAVLMNANKEKIMQFFGLLQVGVGVKSGPELINHLVRHNIEVGGFDTLFVDQANAFNTVERSVVLHQLKYFFPSMVKVFEQLYMREEPSEMYYMCNDFVESVANNTGVFQGNSMGGFLYALGTFPLISCINEVIAEEGIGGNVIALQDDVTVSANTECLGRVIATFKETHKFFGPKLNIGKCKVLIDRRIRDPIEIERRRKLYADAFDIEYEASYDIISSANESDAYGTVIMGWPVGSDEYISNWLKKKGDDLQVVADRIFALKDPQIIWTMLNRSFIHTYNYALRGIPPKYCGKFTKRIRSILDQFVGRFIDYDPQQFATEVRSTVPQSKAKWGGEKRKSIAKKVNIKKQLEFMVRTPISYGGLGLDGSEENSHIQYLSSCLLVYKRIIELLGNRVLDQTHITASLNYFNIRTDPIVMTIEQLLEAQDGEEHIRVQKFLLKRVIEHTSSKFEGEDGPRNRTILDVMESRKETYANVFLEALPNSDNRLHPHIFKMAIAARLLLVPKVIQDSSNLVCVCKTKCNITMEHLLNCKCQNGWINRHNTVSRAWCRFITSAGLSAKFNPEFCFPISDDDRETVIERKKLKVDIRIGNTGTAKQDEKYALGIQDIILDINVTGSIYKTKPYTEKELHKIGKYESLAIVNNLRFMPVCFSASGEWHPQAISLFKGIIAKICDGSDTNDPYRLRTINHWRSFLSCALVRACAKQVLDKLEVIKIGKNHAYLVEINSKGSMLVSHSFDFPISN